MSTKPQGAGSLWNPNSWHWEEKDYTNLAKKLIEDKINSTKAEHSGITLTLVTKGVKGDAQVNIRKGKQILSYDFDIDIEWHGESEMEYSQGTCKIKDFNCLDTDVEIIGLVAMKKTPISEQSKNLVKSQLLPLLKAKFKDFTQELAQYESDPNKISQNQQLREQAEKAVREAHELTGEEKERIFQQQKEKERQMKIQYSQWGNQPQQDQQQQQQQQQQQENN